MIKRFSDTRSDRERGFALVMVLWGVALLGLLAALFGSQSKSSLLIARQLSASVERAQIAGTATTYVIEDLLRPVSSRQWPTNGAPINLTIDETPVVVRVFDEDGKISLNRANKSLLGQLIAATGTDKDPDIIAAAIVDWRAPKPGVVADQASGQGNDSGDGRASIRSWEFVSVDELRDLPSMSDDIFQAICPYVTANSLLTTPDRKAMPSKLKSVLDDGGSDISDSGTISATDMNSPAGLTRGDGLTRSEPSSQYKVYSVDVAFQGDGGAVKHFSAMFTFNQNPAGPLVDYLHPLQEVPGSSCVVPLPNG